MPNNTPPTRPSLTDSPWFWLELFVYFAVLGVLIIGPKYARRQAAIETRFEARREAARRQNEAATRDGDTAAQPAAAPSVDSRLPPEATRDEGPSALAEPSNRPLIVSLAPVLILLLAILVTARLGRMWYSYRRPRPPRREEAT
jgi:hypothetical protein